MITPTTAKAIEGLPAGTKITIQLPDEQPQTVTIEDPWFLLSTPEMTETLVKFKQLELCDAALTDCRKRFTAETEPKFWQSTTGKTIIIGGVSVSIVGAFIAGVAVANSK